MFKRFQITFDAHDAPRLAEFWAVALGYILQPPPPGFETWDDFADSIDMSAEEREAISAVVDPTGEGPRLLFLNVPEAKSAKNRVHLDVNVTDGLQGDDRQAAIDAKVAELTAQGASYQATRSEWGGTWVVMLDPEGNEFCVV